MRFDRKINHRFHNTNHLGEGFMPEQIIACVEAWHEQRRIDENTDNRMMEVHIQ